jgi:EAL domain-containing protein (putative c-di-GMP-specific phosphodiesterase class I)
VVAESVGDDATMQLLVRAGADLAQGFLLGRPTPRRELLRACVRQADRAA